MYASACVQPFLSIIFINILQSTMSKTSIISKSSKIYRLFPYRL